MARVKRTRIRKAGLALAAAAAVAAVLLARAPGDGNDDRRAPDTAYGEWLPVASVTAAAMDGCDAVNAVNQSGMSGTAAKSHTHGNRPGTMWCVAPQEGEAAVITFDLGRVVPLGEMWVWNYNEADTGTPESVKIHRGLKNIRIYTSADGDTWDEFRGEGYPYQLARADGSDRLAATNLNDGKRSPVRFGGIPARYVKLVADEAAGRGNWSDDGHPERAFGLSEVRFYRYARKVVHGGAIDPVGAFDAAGGEASHPEHTVNHYGMSGLDGRHDTHGNDPRTMWLVRGEPGLEPALTVDLGGTYPLGEMWIWNYNGTDEHGRPQTDRGVRDVRIYHSLDGENWTELTGEGYPYRLAQADGSGNLAATNLDGGRGPVDFGGVMARYVKLVPAGGAGEGNWGAEADGRPLYGLSELRFFSAAGIAVEPAPEWTALFSRYEGWTGADGIYSIPLNGDDRPGAAERTPTLFLFSDTYAGRVDPVSRIREGRGLVNNSVALLQGGEPDPAAIRFKWAPKTADLSLFTPHTPAAGALPESWYWLQDGLSRDGKLYLFPLLMTRDPAQPPGFQFAIRGVSLITVPLSEDGPDFARQTQTDTPLYRKLPDGSELVFGAGILDLTEQAGAPNPDGYIYVYGYRNEPSGLKRLLVARTLPDQLETFAAWRFWDGEGWSERIEDAAPLVDGVSAELSVTAVAEGPWKGKYAAVFELNTLSGYIAYAVADSPAGPFSEPAPIHYTPEIKDGQGIITYNAKAHPHLSKAGELLITYNVNTTDAMADAINGDIYRPRWLRIREIAPAS